jgi:Xaa-Pro aminopeptidase
MPDRIRNHRSALCKAIGTNAIAVVPAGREAIRNDDVHHPFRQNSDFFYLTGFPEPDAVAVFTPGHDDGEFHLFVNPRDRETEIWNGYREGVEGAVQLHQADTAYPLADLDRVLTRLMMGREVLYYTAGNLLDDRINRLLGVARSHRRRFGGSSPNQVVDLSGTLSEMRLIKSASEIESLAAACELSAEGHREAMRFTRPGLYEYQVQAAMEYVWREGGSARNGYPSIVASGPNAIILHYTDNDRLIEDNDLILIDAAAEVDYFSSDITRTFPANGRFTPPQHAVYDVVLAAHHNAIRDCRPKMTVRDIHDTARRILTEGLVDLGLLPTGVDQALTMHLYREFFMHGTSHWLGLDVHDAGTYRTHQDHRALTPGMVLTVEPGIYIAPDRPEVEFTLLEYDLDAWTERRILEGSEAARKLEEAAKTQAEKLVHTIPEELLGIGIRIEDDILITLEGHENLTALVPSDPAKIEHLCAEKSWLERV